MGSNFNQHILVDKLVKLNSSQQSIETLSHWCIFHMNKAKQVVETWDRQFHCAPREQRLAFLYLANDILQNSRRKGAEFVGEFWKVLPGSLRDVIENSDEFGKNAALRLINIWEERKVFGSRGLVLKEEVVKKPLENGNRNLKHVGFKLRPPGGNTLDKLVSGYQALYSDQQDEDAIFNKCRNAISFVEKADKDLQGGNSLGHLNGGIKDELKGQHAILKGCIEQLTAVESSRAKLLSILREAMQEQEYKLDQVRNQIQAAQTKSEQAGRIIHGEQKYTPASMEQSTSVIYTRQASLSGHNEEDTKSAAAAVAAKLAASTSSAQMLTYVLSSLASEGVISNPVKQSSNDYPSEKRAKIENENPPNPNEPPPPPPPPPPSSPPPLPPPPVQPYEVPEYMPSAMAMPTGAYGYGLPPPPNAYPTYTTEGGFYGQPSSLPMPPMGRQQN